jgi:hypothetical protein
MSDRYGAASKRGADVDIQLNRWVQEHLRNTA